VAVGVVLNAPPVTVTVTSFEFEQPVEAEVAVRVNIVVEVKFTVVGSADAGFTSRDAGVQL